MIRVMIVDDSAFARKVVRDVLSRDPGIEIVGIARDGLEALEKIADLRPDVVTLDLHMPDLDGLGVLRALPIGTTAKFLIVSVALSDSDMALEALALGAVDLVSKPTPLPTDRLYDLAGELIRKVKACALANFSAANDLSRGPSAVTIPNLPAAARLVVIGTSTGGPQALSEIFSLLPAGLPVPVAVALHIPAGYTAPLAARISKTSAMKMKEAYDGMELVPGVAVIAPGGMHLMFREHLGRIYAVVSAAPLESPYHPSVDLMFQSAAGQLGDAVIGVVMTGMGNDGLKGSQAIRDAGGRVLAESQSSCVIYGMPRCIIEANLATAEAPLKGLPQLIVDQLYPSPMVALET